MENITKICLRRGPPEPAGLIVFQLFLCFDESCAKIHDEIFEKCFNLLIFMTYLNNFLQNFPPSEPTLNSANIIFLIFPIVQPEN